MLFISLNEFLRFIKRTTKIEFGFEHVTIAAVIMGRITNLPFALLSVVIMVFLKEIRNDRFGFQSLGIKSFFWIVLVFASHFLADYSLLIVGTTLVTIRFIIYDLIMPLRVGGGDEIPVDVISWFYTLFLIKILSYFI